MRMLRDARFGLDAFGLLLSAALFTLATQLQSPAMDLVVGVATSFIFAITLDLLTALQGRIVHRDRIRFFGAELVREQTTMVYPDFVMHDDVARVLAGENQQMLFQRPDSPFRDLAPHRIDIPRTVAANDIQALLYVADAFESTTASPNTMVVDSEIIQDCNRSFISFGLSSNDCTHLYTHEAARPLFSIVEDGQGSEYLRMVNGKEYKTTALKQYGLIVRHTPSPEHYPHRRWFLVSGLGPIGTMSAGWYLSRHWRALAAKVPADRNFVAVVSTGPYTDRVPHLEEIIVDEPSIPHPTEGS
ncbi:hypothetical protein ACWGQ5_15780 [Streptomyces sp. NPDC055722]